MPTDREFFPNPYEAPRDSSHARIFLIALILLIGLAGFLYLSGFWQMLGDAIGNTFGMSRGVSILEYRDAVEQATLAGSP